MEDPALWFDSLMYFVGQILATLAEIDLSSTDINEV